MSQGKEQHTNDIFKEKFEDFNIEPAPAVWNNIEGSMARAKRKKLILYPMVGIAASLLLLLVPTWFNNYSPLRNGKELYSERTLIDSTKEEKTIEENITAKEDISKDNVFVATKENDVNNIPVEKQINITTERKVSKIAYKVVKSKAPTRVIIPIGEISTNSLLAVNNSLTFPSKINGNSDLERIRRNIALLNISKDKGFKSQPKLQFNLGKSRTGNSPEYIYPTAKSQMAIFEFSPQSSRSSIVTKPEVKINTDIGINIELPLNKRLSIVSGIRYLSFSDDKDKSDESVPTLGSIDELSTLFSSIGNNTIKEINQSFANIEVPLQLKYYISNRRLSFYVTGGLGANFLIKNNAEIIISDGTKYDSKTDDMTKYTYSGLIGLGISYNINKSIYFSIEPHFRHYFNSLSKNNEIKIKPNITNISFGMGFKF